MRQPIRLIVADDHLIFRQGLKALLKHEPEVTVVGETDRVDALPALLARTPCDQLLLDLQMEHNSLADIESLVVQVPVVVLTPVRLPPMPSRRSAWARAPSCSSASRWKR
jgi:DNA-binding NarL/FixJ family response regulator